MILIISALGEAAGVEADGIDDVLAIHIAAAVPDAAGRGGADAAIAPLEVVLALVLTGPV